MYLFIELLIVAVVLFKRSVHKIQLVTRVAYMDFLGSYVQHACRTMSTVPFLLYWKAMCRVMYNIVRMM